MAGTISLAARREVTAAVAERYRAAGRREKGRILDELCATTGWHRKHAVRVLRAKAQPLSGPKARHRRYGAAIKDALVALWEASDRVCGKRLKPMIPVLLPALARHGRLTPTREERVELLAVSAATIDRVLADARVAAAGGRRRRVGFYSAIRREVPIRTFNDWGDPLPGFCEIDMVAHGGTSVAGSFIQTLTMTDIATGWTECMPLVARDGSLVVEAMTRAQSLFPWLIRGADFDNDSAFMNDVVVPWCRAQKIEVTRSRAYKKNDQAFVEQKNGAVVRRLVGYGRFDGVETARVMARLYASARLHVNYFQPSFKLKEKRREGAKVIKRYHSPATPYERALAHPKLPKAIKKRLRETYRSLDPVALLAEMRRCQEELGQRIDARGIKASRRRPTAVVPVLTEVNEFARALGKTLLDTVDLAAIEPRATHRKPKRRYKTRMRMPSKLDPHLATIDGWLITEPQITALTIVRRLVGIDPTTFGDKQHSIVQRLLRSLRRKAAETALAAVTHQDAIAELELPESVDGAASRMQSAPPTAPRTEQVATRASRRADRPTKPDRPQPGNIPP
jgi:hypothetical protein